MANDKLGELDLTAQHRIAIIDKGTKLKVLKRDYHKTFVRIYSGPFFGEAFWVPAEFVRRQPSEHPELKTSNGADNPEPRAEISRDSSEVTKPSTQQEVAPRVLDLDEIAPSDVPQSVTLQKAVKFFFKRGDLVTLKEKAPVLFLDEFVREAVPGETFEVIEYNLEKSRVYCSSKNKNSETIAINLLPLHLKAAKEYQAPVGSTVKVTRVVGKNLWVSFETMNQIVPISDTDFLEKANKQHNEISGRNNTDEQHAQRDDSTFAPLQTSENATNQIYGKPDRADETDGSQYRYGKFIIIVWFRGGVSEMQHIERADGSEITTDELSAILASSGSIAEWGNRISAPTGYGYYNRQKQLILCSQPRTNDSFGGILIQTMNCYNRLNRK